MTSEKLTIGLLCGGPSLERGISLNSARSVCDHLDSDLIEIKPLYFDYQKQPYSIEKTHLYSNTPSDFDFKLHNIAQKLNEEELTQFWGKIDIALPAIHGEFGEDGQIQRILRQNNCPFIGASEQVCQIIFDKYTAHEHLQKWGFHTLPTILLPLNPDEQLPVIEEFFRKNHINRAIIKPARGGSSIGVNSVNSPTQAFSASLKIQQTIDKRVVMQPFIEGLEFTVLVLNNRSGKAVALPPTEIELDYQNNQIFDYRKKYLPSNQVTYHCPPRFDQNMIFKIQDQAEKLYQKFGINDFARFDGWVLPNGRIYFADFNPISGLEQNSFLFIQASQIGMSHRDVLQYIIHQSCQRQQINYPHQENLINHKHRKVIPVLFGGDTAERQVSVMSGTNVWLKLKKSKLYDSKPYLLDENHKVWELPYFIPLNHTVEEILTTCQRVIKDHNHAHLIRQKVIDKLELTANDLSEPPFKPRKISLQEFIDQNDFIFLGLHGGFGENGTIQKLLEEKQIGFNGPGSISSKLCMDKYQTAIKLNGLEKQGIYTAPKKLVNLANLVQQSSDELDIFWQNITNELTSPDLIIKPSNDGCSAGIVRLFNANELEKYLALIIENASNIPAHTFTNQASIIDLPSETPQQLIFEKFIETDNITIRHNQLNWKTKSNYIEITVGVIGNKENLKTDQENFQVLSPSITVASGTILSVEEKFQGGTGINITPPPSTFVDPKIIELVKEKIHIVAKTLKLSGYARIDAFMHIKTGQIYVIEANTLPALTPSTVLFHQALAENPPMYPLDLIEQIINLGINRYIFQSSQLKNINSCV